MCHTALGSPGLATSGQQRKLYRRLLCEVVVQCGACLGMTGWQSVRPAAVWTQTGWVLAVEAGDADTGALVQPCDVHARGPLSSPRTSGISTIAAATCWTASRQTAQVPGHAESRSATCGATAQQACARPTEDRYRSTLTCWTWTGCPLAAGPICKKHGCQLQFYRRRARGPDGLEETQPL
jgi:hypothetical protein